MFDDFGGKGVELVVGKAAEAGERVGIVAGWGGGRGADLFERAGKGGASVGGGGGVSGVFEVLAAGKEGFPGILVGGVAVEGTVEHEL